MRVIQVKEPNAPLELVERSMPDPGTREVRLKVEACGICHSDLFAVTGAFSLAFVTRQCRATR